MSIAVTAMVFVKSLREPSLFFFNEYLQQHVSRFVLGEIIVITS
jgi:hypothetical protein